MRTSVPAGRSGEWRIERFTIEHDGRGIDSRPDWAIDQPGTYTRLLRGTELFMSDLKAEWHTQRRAVDEARRRGGRILVTGLGLGLVVDLMLDAPEVEHVTVIEIAADVIRLVGPHMTRHHGERVQVIHADAFTWLPENEARFTVGWHDIWPVPQDPKALAESVSLESRFADYCDWQGSWPREYLAAEAQS